MKLGRQQRSKRAAQRAATTMQDALDTYRGMATTILRDERLVALDSAMVGAATAVTGTQALWANIEGDISAVARGFNPETLEYEGGPDPTAIVRDADGDGQHAMFRVMTWFYLTDIISEFWWPDYVWETADFCAGFGLAGSGERRMVALGPDPGRVRQEVGASGEYLGLKVRVALQACVEALAGETVPSDYAPILMAEQNWLDVCLAGKDTMQEALAEQAPQGIHYVKGVVEAREGQPLQHDPPPRLTGDDGAAGFDVAVAFCESARAMLDGEAPFPEVAQSFKDDFNTASNVFATRLGANSEQQWACVTDAIMVGYAVREAEARAGQGQQGPTIEVEVDAPRWTTLDTEATAREAEIPQMFACGRVGWSAVQRWSYAFVSDRYYKRTGDSHELDLITATGYGYAFRRAVQLLSD
jgi:hypothetical protein